MTWVKLDDRFCDNLKVAGLSDKAFRAHVTAICYASGALSDGVVPTIHGAAFTGKPQVIEELLRAKVWERIPDGFLIHDYLQYQDSKEKVLAKRASDSARKNGGNPRGNA